MRVTFMGTGTSQGVPMIAHGNPEHLDLGNPKNWRTRASIHVEMGGHHIQVDAGPEFRLQCLANGIEWIDTFILTHGHADHIVGMDDLRRFCDLLGNEAIPVYSNEEGLQRVQAIFPYAILERPRVRGYPAFRLNRMPDRLELPGGSVRAFTLPHGRFEVLGLVFEEAASGCRCAYFTDCSGVPDAAIGAAAGADVVVLDALRVQPHPSHLSIAQATEIAQRIGGRQTWFTHMASYLDHEVTGALLPDGIALAWDGLVVECS